MVVRYGDNDKYDEYRFCPECEKHNTISEEFYLETILTECKTICTECGHENYWEYGNFIMEYKER